MGIILTVIPRRIYPKEFASMQSLTIYEVQSDENRKVYGEIGKSK